MPVISYVSYRVNVFTYSKFSRNQEIEIWKLRCVVKHLLHIMFSLKKYIMLRCIEFLINLLRKQVWQKNQDSWQKNQINISGMKHENIG